MRLYKKAILPLLMVAILLITGCDSGKNSNNQNLGSFSDIKVSDDVKKTEAEKEKPFKDFSIEGYNEYTTIKNPLFKRSFKVPYSWEVEMINSRQYSIKTKDDPNFDTNTTFNVIFSTNTSNSYAESIEEYELLFNPDNRGITYEIGGKKYFEGNGSHSMTEKYTDSDIDEGDLTSCTVYDDIFMSDIFGKSPRKTMVAFHYSINYENQPMQIRTVVTENKKDIAKKMLKQLASSLEYYEAPSSGSIDADLDLFKIKLPSEFQRVEKKYGVTYRASFKDGNVYSGIVVFSGKIETDIENFDSTSFGYEVSVPITKKVFTKAPYDVFANESAAQPELSIVNGNKVYRTEDSVVMFATDHRRTDFYESVNTGRIAYFLYPEKDSEYRYIAVFTLVSQYEAFDKIMEYIENSLKIS